MNSAISCIVVKADLKPPSSPCVGQTIRILGQNGFFVIMSVDSRRRTLQAMETSGQHRLVHDVPFEQVRRINRNLAKAIHRFLELRHK